MEPKKRGAGCLYATAKGRLLPDFRKLSVEEFLEKYEGYLI